MEKLKIAFDIGGVITRFPDIFYKLIHALHKSEEVELCIITDMPIDIALKYVKKYRVLDVVEKENIRHADYSKYGDNCKKILCERLGINILIDDHFGYVHNAPELGLFVVPRPEKPYYAMGEL